jgi:HK97 family phage prohead protease
MTAIEYRSFIEPIEFRSAENGTKISASGVAVRYGARSKLIEGRFRERFQPGAFAKTLADKVDITSSLEHFGPYLARTTNGTLTLTDDRSLMAYNIDLPDTTSGRDAAKLLEREDVRGSSVGFLKGAKSVWSVDDDGMALRTVTEAKLRRVDLTVAPAYDDSTAELALRSFAEERDMEFRSVLEAAQRGEFAHLIAPEGHEEERSEKDEEDGRLEPTVVRPRITHLMY